MKTRAFRNIVVPVLNRQWTVSFSTTPEFYVHSPGYLQWLTLAIGLNRQSWDWQVP